MLPLSETIQAARRNGRHAPGMQMLVAQMDVIFAFLFGKTITEATVHQELCRLSWCTGVPSNTGGRLTMTLENIQNIEGLFDVINQCQVN